MLLEKQDHVLTLLRSTRRCLSLAIEMLETEQDCIGILYQIQVARATINKCGQILVRNQLQQSLETACFDTHSENRSDQLKNLVDLYSYYQEFS
jgi:DNA-binding FrmR family transcriptional regulator